VNHTEIKGTKYILRAVENLKNKGKDFGFIFGLKVPRDSALRIYEEIDVLVEQFVVCWYGAQAVELMSMGVPVVVWINPKDEKFLPGAMVDDFPFIRANRTNLEEVLLGIIENPESLKEISEKGIVYAKKWHNVMKIAEIMNGIPSEDRDMVGILKDAYNG
jgi:hypothetical protein